MSATATAYATDRGRRPSNQDAVVATVLPDGREVVAVADGMGGHAGGEVASTTALSALVDALHAGAELPQAFRAADEAIRTAAERDHSLDGMGTTLVALLRSGASYWIANVGDSRAYRVCAGGIARVTQDHSFAEEAARAGQMSADEIARSPWKNALTRALGTGEPPEVDVFGPFGVDEPHAVLLCSDGLHGVVKEDAIRVSVLACADAASAAERLSALALHGGSRDNVTVALRDFALLQRDEPEEETLRFAVPAPPPAPEAVAPAAPPAPAPPRPRSGPRGGKRRHGRRRRMAFPAERLVFAACCGALVAWLAYFLSSF